MFAILYVNDSTALANHNGKELLYTLLASNAQVKEPSKAQVTIIIEGTCKYQYSFKCGVLNNKLIILRVIVLTLANMLSVTLCRSLK